MIEKIQSLKTFRYSSSGNRNARILLYVLHGYGQLAPYFIRKFNDLEDHYIIAPEGMHRFYLNGTNGRVGASWMTKEERLDDIEDNCQWLNKLHEHIIEDNQFDKIIVLGFSQGGATAARWFFSDQMRADHLIMWASVFPPDLDSKSVVLESTKKNAFVLGTKDEYYNDVTHKESLLYYSELNFQTFTFEGTHDINIDILNKVLNELK
jgi:predicted esterase